MTGATSKCICGVQPPENDLTTIFVCYFLHVRSSVGKLDWGGEGEGQVQGNGILNQNTKSLLDYLAFNWF